MARPHYGEMPVIDRRHLGQVETLGHGNDSGIDYAERKVQVRLHEFGHALDVPAFQSGDMEAVTAERPEECHLCLRPDTGLQEVPHFPQHR